MLSDQAFNKVNDICIQVFSQPDLRVTAATSAKDVPNWDSMSNLFLIDALEREFGLKFKLDEIINAQNVGDLCEIIARRGATLTKDQMNKG